MKRIGIFILVCSVALNARAQDRWEGRGIWAHPGDFGKSESEVEAFLKLLQKCRIQVVVPLVKDTAGNIFWQSKRFREAVHPDYRDFDLLRVITKVAPKYKIKVHAWLCDFTEGKDGAAFNLHPEWAMLDPQGHLTSEEKLTADQVYGPVWMCPARRPGYTDQWLLPMIEEIVRDYPVDGIHHDYVRYPGDAAPDSYCFCDYCLENYWDENLFFYPSRPDVQVPLKNLRLRQEANWDQDFTVKPSGWKQMTRQEKAEFILEGKSINRADLDYFFYEMRCDAISRFVREAWEKAAAIRPDIEMSAAVFANAMKSGRFIGQRWTDFAPWVDIMMTMTYRSHFQGSFEDYLVYLGDTVRAQVGWAESKAPLLVGIDAHYIFKEELEPWELAINILKSGQAVDQIPDEKQRLELLQRQLFMYLSRFSAPRAKDLFEKFQSYSRGDTTRKALADELNAVLSDPPPHFFPENKLIQTIETVRKAGSQGVVIFAASHLTRKKLWWAVEKAFTSPAQPIQAVPAIKNQLSIRNWKALWRSDKSKGAAKHP